MSITHCVFILVNLWFTVVDCQEASYEAVVVEYGANMNFSLTYEERVMANTKNYIDMLETVTANKTIDLILYPETTLMYLNPYDSTAAIIPPLNDVVLCNSTDGDYAGFLKEFSCTAIKYNTTIVINFTEKVKCSDEAACASAKDIYYNTNVAFGSNGSVISRYRKYNLFGEYGKSKPDIPDISTFQIRNITFGIMTCFDIQFATPSFNLTKQKNVKNILFPLNWISELPYLTALQIEQMWAQELDVVLLAAGASNPETGAGGSGIFLGKHGPLDYEMLSASGTKVISQTVPSNLERYSNESNVFMGKSGDVDIIAKSMDNFMMLVDPSIKDHSFIVLDSSANHIFETVCHENNLDTLCCSFNISIDMNVQTESTNKDVYSYLLVAYTGIRTYSGLYNGGVDTCGVVACLNQSVESCGQRFKNYSNIAWPVIFNAINITGSFTQSDDKIQFPTTLISSIRPLPVDQYSWENDVVGSNVVRTVRLNKPQDRLLTFGIFGRDFSRDYDPKQKQQTENKSNILNIFFITLVLCFVINKVLL